MSFFAMHELDDFFDPTIEVFADPGDYGKRYILASAHFGESGRR